MNTYDSLLDRIIGTLIIIFLTTYSAKPAEPVTKTSPKIRAPIGALDRAHKS